MHFGRRLSVQHQSHRVGVGTAGASLLAHTLPLSARPSAWSSTLPVHRPELMVPPARGAPLYRYTGLSSWQDTVGEPLLPLSQNLRPSSSYRSAVRCAQLWTAATNTLLLHLTRGLHNARLHAENSNTTTTLYPCNLSHSLRSTGPTGSCPCLKQVTGMYSIFLTLHSHDFYFVFKTFSFFWF